MIHIYYIDFLVFSLICEKLVTAQSSHWIFIYDTTYFYVDIMMKKWDRTKIKFDISCNCSRFEFDFSYCQYSCVCKKRNYPKYLKKSRRTNFIFKKYKHSVCYMNIFIDVHTSTCKIIKNDWTYDKFTLDICETTLYVTNIESNYIYIRNIYTSLFSYINV